VEGWEETYPCQGSLVQLSLALAPLASGPGRGAVRGAKASHTFTVPCDKLRKTHRRTLLRPLKKCSEIRRRKQTPKLGRLPCIVPQNWPILGAALD